MLSVRHELVAARVRAEQQAAAAGSDGKGKLSLLQLLPPSQPPSNPVLEGIRAAQQAAAAAAAEDASSSWSTTPDAADVRVLRRSTWRQLLQSGSASSSRSAAEAAAPGSPSGAEAAAEAAPRPLLLQGAASPAAVAAGSSSSSAARVRPSAADSPSLEALISQSSKGLNVSPLFVNLAEGLGSPPHERSHQQSRGGSQQQQQRQQLGSPCMAESCASVSVACGSGRHAAGFGGPLRLVMSPMQSAAASFMPLRPQHSQQQREEAAQQRPGSSLSPHAGTAVARGAPPSPPLPLFETLSPAAGSPAAAQQADSDGDSSRSSSPVAPARSWRQEAAEAAAATAAAADMASPASGSSSRRRAASVAFTPLRRLGDSPLPEPQPQRPQRLAGVSSPLAPTAGGNCTPVSRLHGGSTLSSLHAATPAPSPILQPVQQRAQQSWRQGGLSGGSPGSPQLLASCFKSKPLAPSPFAAAAGSPLAAQQQEPWTLAAARSPSAPVPATSGSLDSPRGSAGRRRSRVITTSSPQPSAHARDAPSPALPHRLASGGVQAAGGSDLVSGLRALDSPVASSLSSRPVAQASVGASRGKGGTVSAGSGGGAFDLAELQRRLLAIDRSKGRS